MTSAFLQLELEPGSRSITTFSTHQGLHRYKRLNFGTSSTSEELQIKLENILRDIPGCKNIAGNMIPKSKRTGHHLGKTIVHGCEKFSLFILGSDFEILTDHKPLVSSLSNPKSTLPLRIERWCLRLQGFSFNIRHINGSFNPADYCFRHTVPDSNTNSTRIIEEYVNFTTKHAEPIVITLDEIKVHTKNDPTLQCLKELICSTKWYSIDTISTKYPDCNVKELHLYNIIRNELTCNNDESLILRGNRIVAPTSLRHRLLKLAHETHLGMTKPKSILTKFIFRILTPKSKHFARTVHCVSQIQE
ncbi:uncharacterized protein LOC130623138 [Hydractinia symbiolongicarpus]|uniref:uncharacterized protein LOC130623138 n=1 Tax=Hydractinia symbiolongicarpus TaxID=13093 RepID=UPI00254E1936|nr:uncharacterized protein LOC130623138 [Hydractinia symbiolongicarpus]